MFLLLLLTELLVVHDASIGRLTQSGHGDIILYYIILYYIILYYMGHSTGIRHSTKMGYSTKMGHSTGIGYSTKMGHSII